MLDDGKPTASSEQQRDVEERVATLYQAFWDYVSENGSDDGSLLLDRNSHAEFLLSALSESPVPFTAYDPIRPWVTFWCTHALSILDQRDSIPVAPIVSCLSACQHPDGGYGGGPGQTPHLACTYAAVATLVTLGTKAALASIDRPGLKRFVLSLCVPGRLGGGVTMHAGGERDIRAAYIAVAIFHMVNLDLQEVAAASSLVDFVRRCQTYEGGLGGEPGNEAHGAYTYCGLAALQLLGCCSVLDLHALAAWVVQRHNWFEGGFNGRTNKLVDGCYSFWVGGIFSLLQLENFTLGNPSSGLFPAQELPPLPEALMVPTGVVGLTSELEKHSHEVQAAEDAVITCEIEHANHVICSMTQAALRLRSDQCLLKRLSNKSTRQVSQEALYNSLGLQFWLLVACQTPAGLRDKPGTRADFYHTCYGLSGLSAAQHYKEEYLGGLLNGLKGIDPRVNVLPEWLDKARQFFSADE